MRPHAIVALSLLWTGLLVVTSRQWLGDVRAWVFQTTGRQESAQGGPVEGLVPGTVDTDEKAVIAKFLVGYAALWLILTAGTESETTAGATAALAGAIALSASYLYVPKAAANLGLIAPAP